MGKYYSSSEHTWENERKRQEKIGEGLRQLKQLDRLMERAFEEMEYDPYGNMSAQSYNSQARNIQWCEDKNDALHNYTNEIHGILEEKEHDFCKELNKHFEELSLLNIEDYTTKNTLGITQKSNVPTSYYGGSMASRSGEATSYEVRDVLKSNINIMDIQMKTNVLGLEEELREYLSKDDKKLTEAQLQDLKKDFYSSRMQTNFEHEVYSTDFWKGLSQTLDFVPVVGGLKNLIEGIAGYTMVGEKLTGNERVTYGLLGGISGVVDVFTLGTSSKILAAKKGLTKVTAQVLKREVLVQTSVSVTLGWTSQFASEKLRDMGLSSEEIFAIHILAGIAVVGFSKHAAGKKASVAKLDDLVKETGLTPSQLNDIMKYTGKNVDELTDALKNEGMLDVILGKGASGAKFGKSLDDIRYEEYWKQKELMIKTSCSNESLYEYLYRMEPQKAMDFANTGKWPKDIQIPKNSNILNNKWGIDWKQVPEGGYTLDINGNAIKSRYKPQVGDVFDRYGPSDGRYTSPVINGKKFSYDERSLPYVEDMSQYHKYEITGDFSKIKEYVDNCADKALKESIDDTVNAYYNGDYSKLSSYIGEAAPGFNSIGGATQVELPLSADILEKLGLIKEIR